MKLSQIPNLRVEDFLSEQSWIGKLFILLNPLFQSINQVLDRNIDFNSNIRAVTQSYTVNQFQEFSLSWPFKEAPPQCLEVVRASQGSAQTPTILLAAWSFDATRQLITVSRMVEVSQSGVSPLSGRYQFTIRATV